MNVQVGFQLLWRDVGAADAVSPCPVPSCGRTFARSLMTRAQPVQEGKLGPEQVFHGPGSLITGLPQSLSQGFSSEQPPRDPILPS